MIPRVHRCVRVQVACLLVLVSLAAGTSRAGTPEPISIGKVHTIESKILGETRTLLVNLPYRYELFGGRYPVMVLLDGKEQFFHTAGLVRFLGTRGVIPEMMVIGIVNTDRTRDFTPTHLDQDSGYKTPTSGGADKFVRFLEEELFPWVEKNFRTQSYRILVGHCMTGMFATWVQLQRPGLFNAHIAISPYLDWDKKKVLSDAASRLGKAAGKKGFFYASYAGTGDSKHAIDKDVRRLKAVLKKKAPKDLKWKIDYLPDENHDSVVHASIHQALRALYSGWQPKPGTNLAGLKRHYQKLSDRFGYPIKPPEGMLNLMGYRAMGNKKLKQAIAIFSYNVELYPASANVYDSLGEAHEANQQLKLASRNYRKAVELLGKQEKHDPKVMKIYREHVSRVENALQDHPKGHF